MIICYNQNESSCYSNENLDTPDCMCVCCTHVYVWCLSPFPLQKEIIFFQSGLITVLKYQCERKYLITVISHLL